MPATYWTRGMMKKGNRHADTFGVRGFNDHLLEYLQRYHTERPLWGLLA